MKETNLLKAIEVLAGRVLELEGELQLSTYQIKNLREIIEHAEKEAAQ